jgi:hypothetical protein
MGVGSSPRHTHLFPLQRRSDRRTSSRSLRIVLVVLRRRRCISRVRSMRRRGGNEIRRFRLLLGSLNRGWLRRRKRTEERRTRRGIGGRLVRIIMDARRMRTAPLPCHPHLLSQTLAMPSTSFSSVAGSTMPPRLVREFRPRIVVAIITTAGHLQDALGDHLLLELRPMNRLEDVRVRCLVHLLLRPRRTILRAIRAMGRRVSTRRLRLTIQHCWVPRRFRRWSLGSVEGRRMRVAPASRHPHLVATTIMPPRSTFVSRG